MSYAIIVHKTLQVYRMLTASINLILIGYGSCQTPEADVMSE